MQLLKCNFTGGLTLDVMYTGELEEAEKCFVGNVFITSDDVNNPNYEDFRTCISIEPITDATRVYKVVKVENFKEYNAGMLPGACITGDELGRPRCVSHPLAEILGKAVGRKITGHNLTVIVADGKAYFYSMMGKLTQTVDLYELLPLCADIINDLG
ncbi:hypothetical protein HNP86_001794 [Methanococcus maripaludis]|uniref:Uncharacterized protein n=1 Tax=Methanococcus maripaludis TaxID=39152 RepID=A0A7J9NWJ7_METMI|nr:hypothetical protein [Methanococcus maripaludis]MBA2851635.1 hypothetical protein [Methanococcus maripaludis]